MLWGGNPSQIHALGRKSFPNPWFGKDFLPRSMMMTILRRRVVKLLPRRVVKLIQKLIHSAAGRFLRAAQRMQTDPLRRTRTAKSGNLSSLSGDRAISDSFPASAESAGPHSGRAQASRETQAAGRGPRSGGGGINPSPRQPSQAKS